jgi:BirA family biotin operon repressor/biotin-[acetyl-CoA-carboxylase] ligase
MSRTEVLIRLLADGKFHSGEILGQNLGVSRAAVWKLVKHLKQQGLVIHSVTGRGYRLVNSIEPLDKESIFCAIPDKARMLLDELEIFQEIDSTNRYLMQQPMPGSGKVRVCMAERQTEGRGRRGRKWFTPYGSSISMSLTRRFEQGPADLSGLSLATGIAVVQALEGLGVQGIGLKWPNDILWQGRKLAGILIEMTGESNGPCHVVIGIGINIAMPDSANASIDQPWVDLQSIMQTSLPSRNIIAVRVLESLLLLLDQYDINLFATLQNEWQRLDLCAGKHVKLHKPDGDIEGVAAGISNTGALILENNDGRNAYDSGEVSLRIKQK